MTQEHPPRAPQLVPPSDPVLWSPAAEVTDIYAQVLPHLEMMKALLRQLGGAGLAAPQVGIPFRFFVTVFDECAVVINPRVLSTSGSNVSRQEGCLTWPGRTAYAARAEGVEAEWTSKHNKLRTGFFQRTVAQVFQHELDHLDGKCIFPRP